MSRTRGWRLRSGTTDRIRAAARARLAAAPLEDRSRRLRRYEPACRTLRPQQEHPAPGTTRAAIGTHLPHTVTDQVVERISGRRPVGRAVLGQQPPQIRLHRAVAQFNLGIILKPAEGVQERQIRESVRTHCRWLRGGSRLDVARHSTGRPHRSGAKTADADGICGTVSRRQMR